MKKLVLILFISLFAACGSRPSTATTATFPELSSDALNFIVASDLGRNGYYDQKPIAAMMATYAENTDIEFIAAAGDVHHFEGVASVNDPLWMTNYELIYDHPELMIDWFAICGNHEYRGSTQAVVDYSDVSRRWNASSKYYTFAQDSCRFVFIDTSPLIDKYRNDSKQYPDACHQNMERQLQWIDSVLVSAPEKWKVVIGHHPVYAQTSKDDSERGDMQTRLAPILENNNVDVYFCGHIHNFQHIKPAGLKVNYVVNSSGSLARKVKETDGTQFCSPEEGFTLCSVTPDDLTFYFIDKNGTPIYDYKITK